MNAKKRPAQDLYKTVTDKILADLERGNLTWLQPWSTENLAGRISLPQRHNGEFYSGINTLLLWAKACEREFFNPTWMTYKQSQQLGGQVRRGEKGSMVVYASTFEKQVENDNGEEVNARIPFLKRYTVFNVEQIDGLPERYQQTPEPVEPGIERDARLEAFFAATGADIRHGGGQAYYQISDDFIQMPPLECFAATEGYYAILAHESCHWTKHKSRLDRSFGRKRFGDEGYAQEELVAEMGSAFLCARLGITPETREDHAAYIESWLRVLKNDKRAIFTAAAHAQKAVQYLLDLQPQAHLEAAA